MSCGDLACAVRKDDYLKAYSELYNGADPNKRIGGMYAQNPSFHDCKSARMVTLLLENEADINVTDIRGNTILFKCSNDIINVLIDNGANVNAKNNNGDTPLFLAVKKKDVDRIRLLLKHGAKPHIDNNAGVSPSNLALQMDRDDLAKLMSKISSDYYENDESYWEELENS